MNKRHYLQTLAAWLKVSPVELLALFDKKTSADFDLLDDSLSLSYSLAERLSRKYFGPMLNILPYGLYRPVTDILKKFRGRYRINEDIHFEPGPLSKLLDEAGDVIKSEKKEPGPTIICLSHDVDTAACAGFSDKVASIEEKFGLRSTFNILTDGPYKLDLNWLNDLENRGFEIGLHGDYHDLSIGFREKSIIRKRLNACLLKLDRPITGYRAPALSISHILLQVLDELGFRYDSSIRTRCYYSQGVSSGIPYIYPHTSIWEFPLTVQDDGLFRDRNLSDDAALEAVKKIIGEIRPFSGQVVINTHPCYIRHHLRFYQRLMEFLSTAGGVKIMLAKELVEELDYTVNSFGVNGD